MIGIALLALCLFPFIPKSSQGLLKIKKEILPIVLQQDFENQLCGLRESFKEEGQKLFLGKNVGEKILVRKEKVILDDFKFQGTRALAVTLIKIYESKKPGMQVYRFSVEASYKIAPFKKPFNYRFRMAIQLPKVAEIQK